MVTQVVNRINISDYRNVTGNVSNYAKTVFADQIKGIAYSFKVLYEHFSTDDILRNKKLLDDLGILKFGKTVEEGIMFDSDKYYQIVSFPEKNHFRVQFMDKNYTNRLAKDFNIIGNNTKYNYSGHNNDKMENEMKDILDDVDLKLFHLRRNIKMPEIKAYLYNILK